MGSQQTIILVALGIYALVMVAVGLFTSRKESPEGFTIGNRNVGMIPTMGSLSSGFRDGAGLVFWVGAGATFVFGGLLWTFLGVLVGLLFFSLVGPKIREEAQRKNYITIGQMIRDRLGKNTEKTTSIIVTIFAVMLVSMQLYVSGNLISTITSLGVNTSITLVALIVASYVLVGGYSNVIKTDVIQFFLIISLACLPFVIKIDFEPFAKLENYKGYGLSTNIAFFLIGALYVIVSSDVWQRVFSARNEKVIRYGFPLSAITLSIMTLSLFFLGLAARQYLPTETEWGNAFFLIFEYEALPKYVLAYVAVVCIAITMSTLDTLSYLAASTFLKNILPEQYSDKKQTYVKLTRVSLGAVLIIGSCLATTIGDVVQFIFDAASLLFILTPIYVMVAMGWFSKNNRTDLCVAVSTFISVAVYIYMFMQGYFSDTIMIFVPVAVNIVLCSLTKIFTGDKKHA